jgi:hypothetical protein
MAVIAVAPFVLRDVDLLIGTDDYKAHVSQVEFVPSATQLTWTGLDGSSHAATGTATWVCTMAGAQDWDTANSLSQYLHGNEGDVVPITFVPADGQGSFAANVTISPANIGGTGGAFSVFNVALGCTKPVFTPPI